MECDDAYIALARAHRMRRNSLTLYATLMEGRLDIFNMEAAWWDRRGYDAREGLKA